jgi:hypothetical protein
MMDPKGFINPRAGSPYGRLTSTRNGGATNATIGFSQAKRMVTSLSACDDNFVSDIPGSMGSVFESTKVTSPSTHFLGCVCKHCPTSRTAIANRGASMLLQLNVTLAPLTL